MEHQTESDSERPEAAGWYEFRYPLGHQAMRTRTVGGLIAYLQQFPADMPIIATWEGTENAIAKAEVENLTNFHPDEEVMTLVFNVDRY